jgi:hypothetical protein
VVASSDWEGSCGKRSCDMGIGTKKIWRWFRKHWDRWGRSAFDTAIVVVIRLAVMRFGDQCEKAEQSSLPIQVASLVI